MSPNSNDIIIGHMQHWIDCEDLPMDSDESKDEFQENDLSIHNDDSDDVHKKNTKNQFAKSYSKQKKMRKESGSAKCSDSEVIEILQSNFPTKDN
jgi:hypothetical protein